MSHELSSIAPNWKSASETTRLEAGSVHLWAIPLADVPHSIERARSELADDELDRAGRYRFELARCRFVAARVALRRLLAGYLAMRSREVTFVQEALGKPSLDPAIHGNELRFNLSHSADLAVLAVARDLDLGVDVEQRHHVAQAAEISERYFHPFESAHVLRCVGDAQQAAFFRCWTRKEAVIKALGAGLQFPLREFRVPVEHDRSSWCNFPASCHAPSGRIWLQPFEPCEGYVGAMATFAAPSQVRFHTFAP